ncbi:TlpA family protein disulfide reductase [Leptolyngbya sp. 7M]|uniref:TlpA family protein disulfide reductase n=1 Tax=Leptolyngbya sp. 7M TaxID=2812896 RepID=UPI001B8C5609|nr:TlpA disulfide reductase family protein [Leptolyngbya sp. 7M]QYO67183.1 redoxin family protein [Leptolyngbya sp. 7M]
MFSVTNFVRLKAISLGWLFVLLSASVLNGQTITDSKDTRSLHSTVPNVVKIDEKQFAELLKPNGKPLLINFWATWCTPCREEFPDLVKIDAEYKDKIDFITISLDFEEELTTGVPKFLAEMKATMPSYLLITPDETAAISMVSKDWAGGLPFTVLFKADGSIAYSRQGIVKHSVLQGEIDKLLKN